MSAILENDADALRRALEMGADPNLYGGEHVLCAWSHGMGEVFDESLLDILMGHGMNPNFRYSPYSESPFGEFFKTPLNCLVESIVDARRQGRIPEEVEARRNLLLAVLKSGGRVDSPSLSLYGYPVFFGHREEMDFLHSIGADPSIPAAGAGYVIPVVSMCRNSKVARSMVKMGAPVDQRDGWGRNPLFSLLDTVERAPYYYLFDVAPVSLLKFLIKAGNDPFEKGSGGESLIHVAASGGNRDALLHLLEMGLLPHGVDDRGWTPLHWAASRAWLSSIPGGMDVVDVLVERGHPLDVVDGDGYSPLLRAIESGNLAMARRLVLMGADTSVRGSDGMGALDLMLEQYGDEARKMELWGLLGGETVVVEQGGSRVGSGCCGDFQPVPGDGRVPFPPRGLQEGDAPISGRIRE